MKLQQCDSCGKTAADMEPHNIHDPLRSDAPSADGWAHVQIQIARLMKSEDWEGPMVMSFDQHGIPEPRYVYVLSHLDLCPDCSGPMFKASGCEKKIDRGDRGKRRPARGALAAVRRPMRRV